MNAKPIFITTFILLIGFTLTVFSQKITVKGNITNAFGGDPIPFAYISVVSDGVIVDGTQSDLHGNYQISANRGDILRVSSAGFETKEVKITKGTHHISLYPQDQEDLDETAQPQISEFEIENYRVTADMASYHCKQAERHYFDMDDNEEYASFAENRFLPATDHPLSTFSLDVDAASYGNMRRMVNQGKIPQKDAVRVEELINYFNYDYPQPTGKEPVRIVTELSASPWNAKHQLLRIGVKAKEIPSEKLPPSNFVFLIDVSGSMYGATRLDLVKSSLKLLSNNLREKDRVAIVVYAGAAGEVLPSTSGSDRQKILEALDKLTAGGSTAGGEGIQLAYKIAEKNFIPNGNNRIILCTDGDFNVGVSSASELESLIESKRKTGIFLTVLGYGMGNYKDGKLQTLAQKGNGNHAYIDNIQEANKVLVNEFGSTMYAVAKDVKIQVEFNPQHVGSYRLVGYETRLLNKEDFNDDTKDAGELGSGHAVTALYEIIPVGVEGSFGSVDPLKYQQEAQKSVPSGRYSPELLSVKLRYKEIDSDQSEKIEIPVLKDSMNKKPSADFKFAMSVAMFGQLLRDSDFKGSATYQEAIALAREGVGDDPNGYRKEFIRLAEAVDQLAK